uniref:NADH:flavin oxidoreductase/NADH oxidase N-terminal domain-containing protein n=1 Tax=Globisporangium ultimum (strain ATCC 200006 / CBS 805.95 / DAOM BR144) TaxID=431595 RepID=K3WR13_GLOUD
MATSVKDYKLFTPLVLAEGLTLKNRVVFSPLTRARSNIDTRTPNEGTAKYYEQRAGAGLIVTEGVAISPQAFGWYGSPSLYTDEHATAWRNVVDRVYKCNGKIFLQL